MTIYSVGLSSLAHGYCKQVQIITSKQRVWRDIWQNGLLYYDDLWVAAIREHEHMEDILFPGHIVVMDDDRNFLNAARTIMDTPTIIEYNGHDYEKKMKELKQILLF